MLNPARGLCPGARTSRLPTQPNPNNTFRAVLLAALSWGGTAFPIAEIRHHGKVIGWGVTCGRHWNADDHGRTPCKRAITFGNSGLSSEELQRRLKRWWVAGTYDTTWPDNGKKRTHHVKMGGTFLRDFASGEWQDLTDDDLEQICRLHRGMEDAAD